MPIVGRTPVKYAIEKRSVPPVWVVRAVLAVRSALMRLANAMVPPDVVILENVMGMGVPVLMSITTDMGIPDLLAKNGAMTADEIAPHVGARGDMIHRALRYLSTYGIYALDADGRFSNTRVSSEMTKDRIMHNAVILLGGDINMTLWKDVEKTLRTGGNSFERNYGVIWEWFRKTPEDGDLFAHGMAALTAMESAFLAASYPYDRYKVLCDVGGGSGVMLASILTRNPEQRGILLDHPSVIPRTREYLTELGVIDRVELVAGDFFGEIPSGADAYILKDVLHDWTDEQCGVILGGIKRAAKPGTPLLVLEMLLEKTMIGPPALLDMQMALATTGRNRNRAELETLLSNNGFRPQRVIPLPSPTSTIEALST